MSWKRWIIPAVGTGIVAIVAKLPLSWVAPLIVPETAPDLLYQGTVWEGTISQIPVFETANLALHPLSRSANVEAGDGRNYLTARLSSGLASDARAVIDLSTLPLTDQRLQGLIGTVRATVSELAYTDTGCLSAEGQVSTDVLQRNGGMTNWTGPELSGPLTCEDGALLATLSGQDTEQRVDAVLRFAPDGSYRAEITTRTSRQEAGAILPLFGFSRRGSDFVLTEQGKWR